MIEFGGGNIGCPWHGLLDVANKKLATDTEPSLEVAWNGAPPGGSDCFLISIPGLPEPTTSQEEADAGMKWKNYALLSGGNGFTFGGYVYSKNHVLHGKELSRHEFIYVDPAGAPWLVRAPSTGTRLDGIVYISVSVERFGVVGGTPKIFNIGSYEVPFARIAEHDAAYATIGVAPHNWQARITDIDTNGASVMISVPKPVGFTVNCGSAAVVRVGFSGTPGVDFTVDLELVADEAGVDLDDSEMLGPLSSVYAAGYRTINWGDPPMLVPPAPGQPPSSAGIHRSIDGVYFAFDGAQYATTETVSVVDDAPGTSQPLGEVEDGLFDRRSVALWREGYSHSRRVLLGGRFGLGGGVDLCVAELDLLWNCSKPAWSGGIDTRPVDTVDSNPFSTATANISKERRLVLRVGQEVYSSYVRVQGVGTERGSVGRIGGNAGGGAPLGTREGVVSAQGQVSAAVNSSEHDGGRGHAFQDASWPLVATPGVRCFSNGVYSIYTPIPRAGWGSFVSGVSFDTFSGKRGERNFHIEKTAPAGADIFSSEHPVTGEIEISDRPIVWL